MLDNGLKLIVKTDNRAPVAVVQVWYKVGASYEYDGNVRFWFNRDRLTDARCVTPSIADHRAAQ